MQQKAMDSFRFDHLNRGIDVHARTTKYLIARALLIASLTHTSVPNLLACGGHERDAFFAQFLFFFIIENVVDRNKFRSCFSVMFERRIIAVLSSTIAEVSILFFLRILSTLQYHIFGSSFYFANDVQCTRMLPPSLP